LNCKVLQRIILIYLSLLRKGNPDWTFDDLMRNLKLPSTRVFYDLAKDAGFEGNGPLTAADENKALRAFIKVKSAPALTTKLTGVE